jgi:hypothetical protein
MYRLLMGSYEIVCDKNIVLVNIETLWKIDISLLLKQQVNVAKEPIHVGRIFLTVQSLIIGSYALACARVKVERIAPRLRYPRRFSVLYPSDRFAMDAIVSVQPPSGSASPCAVKVREPTRARAPPQRCARNLHFWRTCILGVLSARTPRTRRHRVRRLPSPFAAKVLDPASAVTFAPWCFILLPRVYARRTRSEVGEAPPPRVASRPHHHRRRLLSGAPALLRDQPRHATAIAVSPAAARFPLSLAPLPLAGSSTSAASSSSCRARPRIGRAMATTGRNPCLLWLLLLTPRPRGARAIASSST